VDARAALALSGALWSEAEPHGSVVRAPRGRARTRADDDRAGIRMGRYRVQYEVHDRTVAVTVFRSGRV